MILLLFAQWLPRTALCSWLLSIYNLFPLLSLDGGRALEILLGSKAIVIQKIFLLMLSIVAVYLTVILRFGLFPIAIIALLWVKSRNTPCKLRACKVQ